MLWHKTRSMSFTVAAFYRFTPFADPAALCASLRKAAQAAQVRGTILLANEGINGTIAGPRGGPRGGPQDGPRGGVEAVIETIRALPGCAGLEWKESSAEAQPFRRLKIRVKREIVTMGAADAATDPASRVGTYVAPGDWNTVIEDPDTVVIDTRNAYETGIGTFKGAINPDTANFSEFPAWWQANQHQFEGKRVAMFCTGGIRCEKASSWLLGQGVPEVLHLRGGILKYLETVPHARSRWQGECFVFDERVALGHGLSQGSHQLCHACGRPVAAADRDHPDYREGVSCPACIGEFSREDRDRFAERQRQITLARARGLQHLGPDANEA